MPGGGIRVILYLKVLFSPKESKSLWFSLEGQSKFSVISDCSKRWSWFCMGNLGSVDQIPAMNWSLNVLIGRSAIFWRFIIGGDSWKSMSLALSVFGRWEILHCPLLCMLAYYTWCVGAHGGS